MSLGSKAKLLLKPLMLRNCLGISLINHSRRYSFYANVSRQWMSNNNDYKSFVRFTSTSSDTDFNSKESSNDDDTHNSETDLVTWQVDADIGTITLQSPKTYNALTVEMGQAFSNLIQELLKQDLSIKAIVLQGTGSQAFSAGGNYDWLLSLKQNSVHQNADLMMRFYHSFLCVRQLPVPVIAALQGPAIGAGAGLALACDLRVGAPVKKLLGFNFTRLGIHAGMGCSHFLEQGLGSKSAILNEILLTGRVLSGDQALELGLVNSLSENSKEAAYDLAREVAKSHPLAVRLMLQTLRKRQNVGLEEALQREALAQALCYSRQDWGEGVKAVASKREPSFDPYDAH